jgi:hypothetical protein
MTPKSPYMLHRGVFSGPSTSRRQSGAVVHPDAAAADTTTSWWVR